MTPQLQRYRFGNEEGVFGDCHRTCIAMILDMDRDDVPHFMDGVHPHDQEAQFEAEQAEKRWLAERGLAPVYIPFDGKLPLQQLLDQFSGAAHNVAVILGCTSGNGVSHSVVVYAGQVFNPNEGVITGPMKDGFWWITIYAHRTKELSRAKIEELAMRDPAASVVIQETD
jgi:hypothetical protein